MTGSSPLRSAGALALLLLGVVACSVQTSSDSDQDKGPKKREAARVRTAIVEEKEMVRSLSTTTVVESEREIRVFPRSSGVATEIRCEEGDRVAAGAVLAVLDRRQTKALVEEARIAVREAEDNVRKADIQKSEAEGRIAATLIKRDQSVRDYERNDKTNLISAQALDNLRVVRDSAQNDHEAAKLAAQRAEVEARSARTTLEKSKLALERAELDDSYMLVTAPFAGVIASRSIKVGDAVGPGAPVFVLTDAQNLRAVFHRPQRELSMFLAAGRMRADGSAPAATPLEIRVVAEALPGVEFKGDLQLVSPSIDPQSGSFRVTVRLGGPLSGAKDAQLLPGMLVRLDVVTERHPHALVVPKRSLRREGEQNLVFVVDGGKARRLEVLEGFSDDATVEITAKSPASIAAGQHVVVVGNRELEDGADVQEESVEPAPAPDTKTSARGDAKPDEG